MSNIEIFSEQKKKRVLFTAIFLLLWIPACVIRLFFGDTYIFHIRGDIIATAFQVAGLPFIFISLRYGKCPKCQENAMTNWNPDKCKHCDEPLR